MTFMERTVGFIGAGAMAEALIKSIIAKGFIKPSMVWASDIRRERGQELVKKYGINFLEDNKELTGQVDTLVYAVKPFAVNAVIQEIKPFVNEKHLHISIAAGIPLEFFEQRLPEGAQIIRVMPNTPCIVGEGALAYAQGKNLRHEAEVFVKEMLECTGTAVKVPEHLINAVTGLSGSGPAYIFLIIEALVDGAVNAGLPRDIASLLAAQTIYGSAKMVKETGEHPARLKDMVTTPGGTTIAGIHALEEGKIRATLMNAVLAAKSRADELGRAK